MSKQTSRKPYLIRAINEWILDNGLTPCISVNAEIDGVVVPREFIKDGEVVLNIDPSAVRNLEIGAEYVLFDARFSGRPHSIEVPVAAVIAIYARENGEGMLFVADHELEDQTEPDDRGPDDTPPAPAPRPKLKIVK